MKRLTEFLKTTALGGVLVLVPALLLYLPFRPALLITPEGEREPAYVVEDHGDGQLTVLVPWCPTAILFVDLIPGQDAGSKGAVGPDIKGSRLGS